MRHIQHNSVEQVEGYLQDALEITERLDPPEDLRVAFFNAVVALCSAKQVVMEDSDVSPVARGTMLGMR